MKGGPFIFSNGLEADLSVAAEVGFDSVEALIPNPQAIDPEKLRKLLNDNNLQLVSVGTGAGFVVHKLHLCSPEKNLRQKAIEFISGIIDFAGAFKSKTIIGSMKGIVENGVDLNNARNWLCEALNKLGEHAAKYDVPLLLEPLNRYETNFINRLDEGVEIIELLDTDNVKLLADLFHMNIEEQSLETALTRAANYIGHVHFVDSNRRSPGFGHIDFASVGKVLKNIGYRGCLAVEALPWPDPKTAAEQSNRVYREFILKT